MTDGRSGFRRIGDMLGIQPFRLYLADSLASRLPERDDSDRDFMRWLLLHAAVQAGNGHFRTDLAAVADEMVEWYCAGSAPVPGFDPALPAEIGSAVGRLIETGLRCGLWARLESEEAAADSLEVPRPPMALSHDGNYLYFLRRRRLEDGLLERLERRIVPAPEAGSAGREFPLPSGLPDDPSSRLMTRLSEGRRLLLLSGGPGTGKTTTVAKLLGLIDKGRAEAGAAPLNVALAAPTGRAAARMAESLAAAGAGGVNSTSGTLHGLLGTRPGRPPLRNAENPLEAGLVVVDEASMVDMAMMAFLLEALPDRTPLLLVGDPDQLPSVEAGALLGDLLSEDAVRLDGAVERLVTVHRSSKAVLEAAEAVRAGDAAALEASYRPWEEEGDGVRIRNLGSPAEMGRIVTLIYREVVEAAASASTDPESLFSLLGRHSVLTPLRRGSWGVEAMNARVSESLGGTASPFPGMPVVITRNDPHRNLWNGDRGVVFRKEGRPRALFPGPDGFRAFPLAALPGWEPAWMQTIHKSQGSEFDRVTAVLPEGAERLLTREILYTAFTRARHRVDLFADSETVEASLARRVVRHSRIRRWASERT